MTIRNKHTFHSKISEAKTGQIVKLVAVDFDALQHAEIAGLNCNTVKQVFSCLP